MDESQIEASLLQYKEQVDINTFNRTQNIPKQKYFTVFTFFNLNLNLNFCTI